MKISEFLTETHFCEISRILIYFSNNDFSMRFHSSREDKSEIFFNERPHDEPVCMKYLREHMNKFNGIGNVDAKKRTRRPLYPNK